MRPTKRVSPLSEIFFAICKSVDTPVSLGLWLRYQHNQLALAEFSLPVRDYLDADRFRKDYLVSKFCAKSVELETGIDLEREAMSKFTASETLCAATNARIKRARNSHYFSETSAVLFAAKAKIARLLGPCSLFCVDSGFSWGPGATSSIARRRAFVDTKLCELPISVTRDAFPLLESVIREDLHWSCVILGVEPDAICGPFRFTREVFSLVDECVVDTVPKDAKAHRTIAKEPTGNGFLQKGIGRYLRTRLKRAGIDLDDQAANQEGAFRALEDELCTIDLKSASDSVSIELVYELFPVDWAILMDECRSKRAKLPSGDVITLNKWSSMGNGFTFELETLIFWALASSVMDQYNAVGPLLVYGDDIVCPKAAYWPLTTYLSILGFETNGDKSFADGLFYESCGRHYFDGQDVTPLYQKEEIAQDMSLVRTANRLLRYGAKHAIGWSICKDVSSAWQACYRLLRSDRELSELSLPLGCEGDDGVLLPASHFVPQGWDVNMGVKCTVRHWPQKRFPAHDAALLAWTLRRGVVTEAPYGGYVTSSPDTTSVRGSRKSHRWVMPTWEFGLEV